eukprot:tig00021795_g23519.t1
MIKHIVLLRFAPEVTERQIHDLFVTLSCMSDELQQYIKKFSYGPYSSSEGLNRGFQHGFVMEFNTAKDRDAYLEHPRHKEIVETQLLPILDGGIDGALAFDFEEVPERQARIEAECSPTISSLAWCK